ncbi:PREDICTED: CASP-like protein 4D1 [Erythranthe guttata]|uniref:CASP-like protein 4D1 n=1 Tax=Erythranthe guttata TaxID=4155 RepID=UPI00064E0B69|nr:PREDICTED: CASP-like protein 4D1 [Erythranthe guttata]|eukprot:XP_012845999.1 PREDICTED: CASP-like protein 4D1 [Erythranthe guttata]
MAQSSTPSTQMSVDSESQAADRADKTHEVAEPYSAQAAAQEQAAPPASLNLSLSLSLPIIALVVRIITLVCLILSISLMASNSTSIRIDTVDLTPSNSTTFFGFDGNDYDRVEVISIRFNDIYAYRMNIYRYGLSTAVIGMAYTLLQLGYSIYQVMSGKRLTVNHPTLVVYEFVGDKVLSNFPIFTFLLVII